MQARRAPSAPSFERFEASALFCNHCQAAQPVREHLLLVLPDGELYEYLCTICGSTLGKRRATQERRPVLLA